MNNLTIRRADFMMVLAYATDLATGQSRDFALRSCVLSMRLAESMNLDVEARREVYHQAILRYIGCNADSHLLASAFGDEIALRQDLAVADLGSQSDLGQVFARAFSRVFANLDLMGWTASAPAQCAKMRSLPNATGGRPWKRLGRLVWTSPSTFSRFTVLMQLGMSRSRGA